MANPTPESVDQWLELDCPRCKANFRIKSGYAHMSGRCPNCGQPIDAPRPAPPPAPISFDFDEPLGLVPIEEEWPEPAQMEVDENPHYGFGAAPSQWTEQKAERSPDMEGYAFQDGALPAPPAPVAHLFTQPLTGQVPGVESPPSAAPVQPLAEAYQADLPVSTPVLPSAVPAAEEKKGPERIPSPPPLTPARPLWQGVYTFPWRVENLKVLIALGLGMGLFALLAAMFYQLLFVNKVLDSEGFNPSAAFLVLIIPPMAILGLVSLLYGSAQFLAILEDTAGGNDHYQRPELVTDWFGSFIHLAFISFCAVLPSVAVAAIAATLLQNRWGLALGLIPLLVLFPIFLLSSMAGMSSMAIVHGEVLKGFLRKPLLLPIFFMASCFLMAVFLAMGYLTFITSNFFLALATGFLWAAVLLTYARLTGRVAWVLSQSGMKVRKRRKKRRKKPVPGSDDWSAGAESPPEVANQKP
jgi:predicted Zn finger-like uncharacterized protein